MRLPVFLLALLATGALSAQPNPDYMLSLSDVSGDNGDTVGVAVILDFPDGDQIAGWSYGVCNDWSIATVSSIALGSTSMTINCGAPPAFFASDIVPNGGYHLGIVINFFGFCPLPAGEDYELSVGNYQLVGTSGDEDTPCFCETLGAPPVSVVVVTENGSSIDPVTECGTISVGSSLQIQRGDVDGRGAVSALPDGIYLLGFGFVLGSPAPPCLEAADVDGNGTLNPLVDALALFSFGFVPGSPPPAPPFPDCGPDPDPPTSLGCDTPACP